MCLGWEHAADNVQDDTGFVGGVFLPQITGQSIDTYRAFYRFACCNAGYAEFFVGRSDEQHTIWGADLDIPLHNRMAFYAGFNYLSPDDNLPLTDNEAWNLQMGLTFRPRGNDWYNFDPSGFLECGAAGCFDGWATGDQYETRILTDDIDAAAADTTHSQKASDEVDPVVQFTHLDWETFAGFLWCGQAYE